MWLFRNTVITSRVHIGGNDADNILFVVIFSMHLGRHMNNLPCILSPRRAVLLTAPFYLYFGISNIHPKCTSLNGKKIRVTGPLCGNSSVTGEFPSQRPVSRSCDVFFDLRLNKWLSKHSWGWWFETPSRSLWRHRNVYRVSGHDEWVLLCRILPDVHIYIHWLRISYLLVHPLLSHIQTYQGYLSPLWFNWQWGMNR